MNRSAFHLKVRQVGTHCNFDLSWGQGQSISVELSYPLALTRSYQQWQSAYLNYYRRLRGRKALAGKGSIPVDRHQELVNAEAQLLDEFQRWLLSPELVSISRQITKATHQPHNQIVEVFLVCTPHELGRLPWETWDLGRDLETAAKIRLVRTPANILNEPVRPIYRKLRVLTILGDNTGLNLAQDTQALRSLFGVASITILGWQRNQTTATFNLPNPVECRFFEAEALKREIPKAIADERGWDILFFAGHSNETVLTGGELGIAPHTSIAIAEIESSLKQAKKRGLQFAIFNSCSGINIAESLINLGLSQVAVMREPIHDDVAQEFLVQFLQSLAEFKDVHTALLDASQFLKQPEKRLSYPSAYLVPSLFRHPGSELFRIKPFGFLEVIKRWLPTKLEAQWLVALLLLSLLPPAQSLLLEPRIWLQAVYRQLTFQVSQTEKSPIRVIQIDERSLQAQSYPSQQVYPIDYSYLALLLDRLVQRNAKIIGIDYVLDDLNQPANSLKLRQSVENAVNQETWLVFASGEGRYTRRSEVSQDIASKNWSLAGDISFYPGYLELLPAQPKGPEIYPFSYLLAIVYTLNQNSSNSLSSPNLQSQESLKSLVIEEVDRVAVTARKIAFLQQARLHPLTSFSQPFLQNWWQPIVDFSIPPDVAYESISAYQLLEQEEIRANWSNDIILIIPGGYKGAGLAGKNEDNYAIPLAIGFWRGWQEEKFPGGEIHAYMLHHFLTQRLVVPIPDAWIILLAAVLGKIIVFILQDRSKYWDRLLFYFSSILIIYLMISLQVYITFAILFPWFLPSILLFKYVRIAIRGTSDD